MGDNMKRIGIYVILFFISIYAIYDVCSYISSNNSLNKMVEKQEKLLDKVNNIGSSIENKQKNIETLYKEITDKKMQISEKENTLNLINTEIEKNKGIISIINNNGAKKVFLTFDDGPSIYTSEVLNILKKYNIKATFFVNGKEDSKSIAIYKRIVDEGHSIGNHTYAHKYQTVYSSIDAFDIQFNKLQNLIKNTTGITMNIMRFPGGSNNSISNNYSPDIMNILTDRYKKLGYKYFDWNVSAGDGTSSGVTKESVIKKISSETKGRDYVIILMHDSMPTTPAALETVILNLANSGFNFYRLTSSSKPIQFK
jgi:peptidoglycan/xylan/chitin deacetylase (PgdA/CDA1 family)